MKLKDKKIEIQEVQYVSDKYGNRPKQLVTVVTVWAYFRQLSGDEIYRVTTQTTEEMMFRNNYRSGITCVDVYEGYKNDLTLYCKRQEN